MAKIMRSTITYIFSIGCLLSLITFVGCGEVAVFAINGSRGITPMEMPFVGAENPPRQPSLNAVWAHGYHVKTRNSEKTWMIEWVKVDGQWRVPISDIPAQLTMYAPSLPEKSPPEESKTQKKLKNMVWCGGYFQWNVRSFEWVKGSWQIPPTPNHFWREAQWKKTQDGAVLYPGHWYVKG